MLRTQGSTCPISLLAHDGWTADWALHGHALIVAWSGLGWWPLPYRYTRQAMGLQHLGSMDVLYCLFGRLAWLRNSSPLRRLFLYSICCPTIWWLWCSSVWPLSQCHAALEHGLGKCGRGKNFGLVCCKLLCHHFEKNVARPPHADGMYPSARLGWEGSC